MTGPVTIVGNMRLIIPAPPRNTTRLRTKYTTPAAASPDRVADKPYCSTPKVIGAMKAKDDAR